MKPATRHKETIAGIEVETFPTTYRGKYVRGVRCWNQSYLRLVMPKEIILIGDQFYVGDDLWERWSYAIGCQTGMNMSRRRVGRKP